MKRTAICWTYKSKTSKSTSKIKNSKYNTWADLWKKTRSWFWYFWLLVTNNVITMFPTDLPPRRKISQSVGRSVSQPSSVSVIQPVSQQVSLQPAVYRSDLIAGIEREHGDCRKETEKQKQNSQKNPKLCNNREERQLRNTTEERRGDKERENYSCIVECYTVLVHFLINISGR